MKRTNPAPYSKSLRSSFRICVSWKSLFFLIFSNNFSYFSLEKFNSYFSFIYVPLILESQPFFVLSLLHIQAHPYIYIISTKTPWEE